MSTGPINNFAGCRRQLVSQVNQILPGTLYCPESLRSAGTFCPSLGRSAMDSTLHELFDGQAYCWVEQGSSVMVKVVSKCGDPVELRWCEARELGKLLIRLADEGQDGDP